MAVTDLTHVDEPVAEKISRLATLPIDGWPKALAQEKPTSSNPRGCTSLDDCFLPLVAWSGSWPPSFSMAHSQTGVLDFYLVLPSQEVMLKFREV